MRLRVCLIAGAMSVAMMMGTDPARAEAPGIARNNPGNIRITQTKWDGMVPDATGAFYRFTTPEYGIRALYKNLKYVERLLISEKKPTTVREIIRKWAPSHENPTQSYVHFVAQHLGVDSNSVVNLNDYNTARGIVGAIIKFENGNSPYSDAVIDTALEMGGLAKPGTQPAKPITARPGGHTGPS